MPTLPRILKPLDDNDALIDLIARVSWEPPQTVARRLLDEERCLGTNVRNDLKAFGLAPHEWSDRLVEFYATTHAFLYETAVWNRVPLKCDVRSWIVNYLHNYSPQPLRILRFGDGLGFDSAALAGAGHEVVYFEPSQPCVEFAKTVFAANDVKVRIEQSPDGIRGEQFDAVLSLDVLEHVPDPPSLVGTFADWLEPNGLLITHSPFFLVYPYYSTHLRANQKYSGDWSLYRRHGLHPIAGQFFWEPIVLQKTGVTPPRAIPLSLRMGGWLLSIGRGSLNLTHCLRRDGCPAATPSGLGPSHRKSRPAPSQSQLNRCSFGSVSTAFSLVPSPNLP